MTELLLLSSGPAGVISAAASDPPGRLMTATAAAAPALKIKRRRGDAGWQVPILISSDPAYFTLRHLSQTLRIEYAGRTGGWAHGRMGLAPTRRRGALAQDQAGGQIDVLGLGGAALASHPQHPEAGGGHRGQRLPDGGQWRSRPGRDD